MVVKTPHRKTIAGCFFPVLQFFAFVALSRSLLALIYQGGQVCKGPSLSPFVLINRPTLPFPPTDRSVVFRDSAIRKRTRYNLYDERGGDDDDDVMLASPQKCQPQSAVSYSFHPCCPPAARWVGRWFGKRSYVPLCHLTFRLPGVGVCVCV